MDALILRLSDDPITLTLATLFFCFVVFPLLVYLVMRLSSVAVFVSYVQVKRFFRPRNHQPPNKKEK